MDDCLLRQASKGYSRPGKVGGFQDARPGMITPQKFHRWLLRTVKVPKHGSWHEVSPGLLSGYTFSRPWEDFKH